MRICINGHSGASEHREKMATKDLYMNVFSGATFRKMSGPSHVHVLIVYPQLGERKFYIYSTCLYMTRSQTIFLNLSVPKSGRVRMVTATSCF